ncbi:head-tail connector protein [Mesorhizobium sp. AA22]|uniref:head-tail connector protein n=1 Tax=Mesorhizobium sp. AA22 TaxID=1854057 RepID=UPI0007EC43CF|nr:head-tail connector protein [Mesorhizobium sp. AA22]QIA23098.1 phage gp6-like head-tail connector protein [Mesorhizobium sp. AA22]
MAIVTLAEQKAHLGVTLDSDDDLISAQIDAAQAHIEQLLGFVIAEEFASPLVVPADLIGAVMTLAAHLFENREATVVGISAMELPLGVWDVVRERRNYSF